MSNKAPGAAFDHQKFMEQEFPKPTGRYPNVQRLSTHLNKITSLLQDSAIQTLRAEADLNTSPLHTNTRYTIVGNYRLRTISLLKMFTEIVDIEGDSLFDEGTANIIVRSLLESYLVYYQLYNRVQSNKQLQDLYFNLYDLSSRLQFVKSTKILQGLRNPPDKSKEFSQRTDKIITEIITNSQFNALPIKVQQAVKLVRDGKRDYLSFINFTALIKESPLPTQLITTYYSYASAFAHSEGFSSDVSQMVFESRKNWGNLNELFKFRLMYFALAISSQFFHSFIDYDKTQLEDEKELEVCEVISLTSYYLKALAYNS